MHLLDSISITAKILAATLSLAFLTAIVGIYGLYEPHVIEQRADAVRSQLLPATAELGKLSTIVRISRATALGAVGP